jgi:F-type H+-transporting ATPase subunit gamma
MEQLERLTIRLDNIQAVEPILNALRAISSSSRLQALKKASAVEQYGHDLRHILSILLPRAAASPGISQTRAPSNGKWALLVIGSERGLCGAFNKAVVEYADQLLTEYANAGRTVQLMTLGARVQRGFRNTEPRPSWSGHLSPTGLAPFHVAQDLVQRWRQRYRSREIEAVEVVYNSYRGLAHYEPCVRLLFPPQLPPPSPSKTQLEPWVETDPRCLFDHAMELWLSALLYGMLLDSAAAEHSARFRLLDGASQNAERLIEELKLYLQTARQEAITTELQDLAIGAGLLERRSE